MPSLTFLPQRALISVRGRDTFKYLQALTTNKIVPPCSQFSSFLNAQGRVLYDVFIYQTAESDCLIEVDVDHVDGLMSHLKRYKLRSKIELRALDSSEMKVHSIYSVQPGKLPQVPKEFIHQEDRRAPDFGLRILAQETSQLKFMEANEASVSNYTIHRYLQGIPEGADEIIAEKALPMESNIDYMNGLEFHKGCYLGQELTVRTYHTGVIRKRIVPLRLFSPGEEPPATLDTGINFADVSNKWLPKAGERCDIVKAAGGEIKGRPAGRLLTSIGQIGLGLCRMDKLSRGIVKQDERELGIMPFRPTHWPAVP